jgi:hypothetical protein
MTQVIRKLITDLHPSGVVRIAFPQHVGGGYERPLTAKNLNLAEAEFITLGLTLPKSRFIASETGTKQDCRHGSLR